MTASVREMLAPCTGWVDGRYHMFISNGPKPNDLIVSLMFGRSQAGFVTHIPLGTKVEASCKIDEADGRDSLFLTDCELVKP